MNATICHKEKDLQKSITSTLRDEVLTGDNAYSCDRYQQCYNWLWLEL